MYKDENHYTLCLKDGRNWGYYWYDENNKRHFRSTGRKTKHEAMRVINERIRKGELGFQKRIKDVYFKDYAKGSFDSPDSHVLKSRERTGRTLAETSIDEYRRILDRDIMPYFGNHLLRNITTEEIMKFQDMLIHDRKLSFKTINKTVHPLRLIIAQAKRDDLIKENPFNDLEQLKESDSTKKPFTLEQIQAMVGHEWPHELSRLAFEFAALTGLRIGEIQALRIRSIQGDKIIVSDNYAPVLKKVKDVKNHQERVVPFPEPMRDRLEWLANGRTPDQFLFSKKGDKPYRRNAITEDMHAVMKALGIEDPDLTFHSTRHFFDSYLYLKAGVEKEKIMKVIGHKSEDMFRHYLHICNEDLDSIRGAQMNIVDND